MNQTDVWLVIIGLTLVTVATRSFFLVLGDLVRLPERVQHALRYAPACALTALVVPEFLFSDGQLALSIANPKLIAGAVTIIAMLITRGMVAAMALGMAAFALLRML
jgi:branched-subunit amino acid transport protein